MSKLITGFTQGMEILAGKNKYLYKLIAKYYRSIVINEVKLAGINADDTVLCVGGGPCPFTGILLHEYSGARVTIIDNDNRCIACSREVVESLGYEDDIEIKFKDGTEICPKDYSVVHLALQVSPILQVVQQLERNCSLGTKILIRQPKEHLASVYDKLGENSLNCSDKIAHSGMQNVGHTAMYIKKGETSEASEKSFAYSDSSTISAASMAI